MSGLERIWITRGQLAVSAAAVSATAHMSAAATTHVSTTSDSAADPTAAEPTTANTTRERWGSVADVTGWYRVIDVAAWRRVERGYTCVAGMDLRHTLRHPWVTERSTGLAQAVLRHRVARRDRHATRMARCTSGVLDRHARTAQCARGTLHRA